MDEENFLIALELAYNHGFDPRFGVDEYYEILSILGREPTSEEANLLSEIRSEGFKKRSLMKLNRK